MRSMVYWRISHSALSAAVRILPFLCLLLGVSFSACLAAEPVYRAEVVQRYPHDPAAFTQGLFFLNGLLYEGTGLYGESSLRQVRLEDGEVLKMVNLEPEFFGEGLAVLDDRIYQLTWREGVGFIYDLESLEKVGEFAYEGQGWGLTTDGIYLIMSDGSSVLRYLDPDSLEPVRWLPVRGEGGEVQLLNELEYVDGEIWANIWLSSVICRLDPATGRVLGWIDLRDLAALELQENPGADVLNGIAFHGETGRIFVTGKLWSSIYQIRLLSSSE